MRVFKGHGRGGYMHSGKVEGGILGKGTEEKDGREGGKVREKGESKREVWRSVCDGRV